MINKKVYLLKCFLVTDAEGSLNTEYNWWNLTSTDDKDISMELAQDFYKTAGLDWTLRNDKNRKKALKFFQKLYENEK